MIVKIEVEREKRRGGERENGRTGEGEKGGTDPRIPLGGERGGLSGVRKK